MVRLGRRPRRPTDGPAAKPEEAVVAQRVEYECLPATRYDQYISKLRLILGALSAPEGTDFKTFRENLRRLGLWDRDRAEGMLSIVDLTWDRKAVRIGPLAKAISAAGMDDEAVKRLLFQRLKRDNVILVKYVLEALDVDGGGRLHSVHELYRMVTSYVYPGTYITLPNFQAWVDWLAASGHIKLVGIRWALSDLGMAVIPELRGIDVEEILEDMAEEADSDDEDDEDDLMAGVGAPTPGGPASAPPPAQAPHAHASGGDDDEELFDDLPPEAAPPSAAALAQAAAKFEQAFDTPLAALVPEVAAPAQPTPPAAAPAAASGARSLLATADVAPPARAVASGAAVAALVERAKVWWAELGDWPAWTAPALGVQAPAEAEDSLLLELGVLALLVEGLPAQPQGFAFAKRMRAAGFFEALAGDGGLSAALDALGELDAEPWARAMVQRVAAGQGLRRRLLAKPGLLARVKAAKSGAAAVGLLRAELFGGGQDEAPFWVLRELLRLDVVAAKKLGDAAAVPTARLVANAQRVGLVAVKEVASFEELVAVSVAVSAHFGADAGYGEALAALDRGLGLGA
jgi:hypothetical protein